MGHGIVVGAQAIRLCDGCSAELAVLERQLDHAAGVAAEEQASAHERETRVLTVLEILRGRWAVAWKVEAESCASSRVPSVLALATVFRDFRWMISSSKRRASSASHCR